MGLGRLSDGLAPTPPLGWNSWNRFHTDINESLVLETAEALIASGMKDVGYRYVVLDDGWELPARDAQGDLVADPMKFPKGMRALADRLHALGLRFGIYTDAGTNTCQGLPGSLGYEFRDARRFAEWGADYVKVDWCHTNGMGPRALYAKWALAFKAANRPMVLSICEWGRARPWEWAPTLGHLWRTCWDIQDEWSSVTTILDRQAALHPYAGPDHWNDPDMLEVGNGGMSDVEYRTHFSLWAMLAAPLMAGNDLRSMPAPIRDILAAPEVVAVDQDPLGRQARRLRQEGETELWARELAAPGTWAVALVNRASEARALHLDAGDLGVDVPLAVRDAWERADLRTAREHVVTVPAHGTALWRVSAPER